MLPKDRAQGTRARPAEVLGNDLVEVALIADFQSLGLVHSPLELAPGQDGRQVEESAGCGRHRNPFPGRDLFIENGEAAMHHDAWSAASAAAATDSDVD